ncbi:MAG: hypothetical protein IMZ52_00040 [Actinobacteria bacterium]|nr:hypothetical protein [Actinomycetota bacterium]MBE3114800.1 hypothetical protein [Actinomycetota bacterium]
MEIKIRPKDGQVDVFGVYTKEDMMFEIYCVDEMENGFCILLTRKQMKELKKQINGRTDIDKKRKD